MNELAGMQRSKDTTGQCEGKQFLEKLRGKSSDIRYNSSSQNRENVFICANNHKARLCLEPLHYRQLGGDTAQ